MLGCVAIRAGPEHLPGWIVELHRGHVGGEDGEVSCFFLGRGARADRANLWCGCGAHKGVHYMRDNVFSVKSRPCCPAPGLTCLLSYATSVESLSRVGELDERYEGGPGRKNIPRYGRGHVLMSWPASSGLGL
jgi:hypothetical protein